MTKQQWKNGDIFTIKLKDNTFVIGQVIAYEPQALNSVICAFYDIRNMNLENIIRLDLKKNKIFSIMFVTRDLLDSGRWNVITTKNISMPFSWYFKLFKLRKNKMVGVKIIGSGIVESFINSFYSLEYWNNYKDPYYLDGLLISKSKKPKEVLYK